MSMCRIDREDKACPGATGNVLMNRGGRNAGMARSRLLRRSNDMPTSVSRLCCSPGTIALGGPPRRGEPLSIKRLPDRNGRSADGSPIRPTTLTQQCGVTVGLCVEQFLTRSAELARPAFSDPFRFDRNGEYAPGSDGGVRWAHPVRGRYDRGRFAAPASARRAAIGQPERSGGSWTRATSPNCSATIRRSPGSTGRGGRNWPGALASPATNPARSSSMRSPRRNARSC